MSKDDLRGEWRERADVLDHKVIVALLLYGLVASLLVFFVILSLSHV